MGRTEKRLTDRELLLLIASAADGTLAGRTVAQKLAYFGGRKLEQPTGHTAYYYGPYSDEITAALKDGRVLFAYQPVVGAKSRVAHWHECLLRIERPDGTLLPAKDFIPAAEALGLVRLLDRRALELAVAQLYRNTSLKLAINVSGTTASDRSWLISFLNYVREHRRIAPRLTVELTETAALNGFEENARFVTRLRDAGCRVAIDDFGAGHTSFRSLQQLRVDTVKIDGMYVEHLSSEQDALLLDSFGIDYFQGHHFGRPEIYPSWMSADAAIAAA